MSLSIVETDKRKCSAERDDSGAPPAKSKFPVFVSAGNMKSLEPKPEPELPRSPFTATGLLPTNNDSNDDNWQRTSKVQDLRSKLDNTRTQSKSCETLTVTINSSSRSINHSGGHTDNTRSTESMIPFASDEMFTVGLSKPSLLPAYASPYTMVRL